MPTAVIKIVSGDYKGSYFGRFFERRVADFNIERRAFGLLFTQCCWRVFGEKNPATLLLTAILWPSRWSAPRVSIVDVHCLPSRLFLIFQLTRRLFPHNEPFPITRQQADIMRASQRGGTRQEIPTVGCSPSITF